MCAICCLIHGFGSEHKETGITVSRSVSSFSRDVNQCALTSAKPGVTASLKASDTEGPTYRNKTTTIHIPIYWDKCSRYCTLYTENTSFQSFRVVHVFSHIDFILAFLVLLWMRFGVYVFHFEWAIMGIWIFYNIWSGHECNMCMQTVYAYLPCACMVHSCRLMDSLNYVPELCHVCSIQYAHTHTHTRTRVYILIIQHNMIEQCLALSLDYADIRGLHARSASDLCRPSTAP